MNNKKLSGIVIVIIGIIVGCSGDYGLVRRQRPTDNKMTLAELKENWEDYHIYDVRVVDQRTVHVFQGV